VVRSRRAMAAARASTYEARAPTQTVLYGLVREHLASRLQSTRETYTRPLPAYVEDAFRAYLRCGVFAHGFARLHCKICNENRLLAFSCKGRAMCPSCAGRPMANTAAHSIGRVLPRVPVRQYVLSLPFELRTLAAFRADVLTMLSRIFFESIRARYRECAKGVKALGSTNVEAGAITFVQRFGSSLNLNVHFHVVVLDGVFSRNNAETSVKAHNKNDSATFHATPPPTQAELVTLVARVEKKALTWLRRRGLLRECEEKRGTDEVRCSPARELRRRKENARQSKQATKRAATIRAATMAWQTRRSCNCKRPQSCADSI
jgi:Transposase zinc-binding domain/Putative transposase